MCTVEDRWAIIAYVRALQRSQLATADDVPEPERAAVQEITYEFATHIPAAAPLDLSKWRNVPVILMVDRRRSARSRGLAFGGSRAIRVFVAAGVHVFSEPLRWAAGFWSWCIICLTPVGRCRRGVFANTWPACSVFRWCFLFLPIAILRRNDLSVADARCQAHPDHALRSKYPLFTMPGYYVTAAVLFGIWWLYSNRLRYWSLQQDETGAAECTQQDARSMPPRALCCLR